MKIEPIVTLMVVAFTCSGIAAQKPVAKEQIQTDVVQVLVSPAEAREIRQVLDLQGDPPGSPRLVVSRVDQVIDTYRKAMTQVPEKVWQDLTVEMKNEFSADRFAQKLIPVYASSFTASEIRELARFFSSPVGRKWAEQLPKIQKESYNAGYDLGRLLGERIRASLQGKGYSLSPK